MNIDCCAKRSVEHHHCNTNRSVNRPLPIKFHFKVTIGSRVCISSIPVQPTKRYQCKIRIRRQRTRICGLFRQEQDKSFAVWRGSACCVGLMSDQTMNHKGSKALLVDESSVSCNENHQEEFVRVQTGSKWENRTASSRKPGMTSRHACIGTEALLTGVFDSDSTSVDTLFDQQLTCFRDIGEERSSAPSEKVIPPARGATSPGAYRIQPPTGYNSV
jgi:hypothetical protein